VVDQGRDFVSDEAVIASTPSLQEFKMKIDGASEAVARFSKEKALYQIAVITAKRKLAGMIDEIISEREAMKASIEEAKASIEETIDEEVEAIIASITGEAPKGFKVKGQKVKGPAKPRGEIKGKSLEDLGTCIVHRQVEGMKAKRLTKAEAIDLSGQPEVLFEEAAYKAVLAGEEEVLTSSESQAVILVRRVGTTRRFFAKVAA
jgi:hypothetical protein